MRMHILAIRDLVADVYLMPPMFVHNIGAAVRDFGDECQREDKNNRLAQHPEHYELWHIGNIDDQDASIECRETNADARHDEFHRKQLAVGSNYSK